MEILPSGQQCDFCACSSGYSVPVVKWRTEARLCGDCLTCAWNELSREDGGLDAIDVAGHDMSIRPKCAMCGWQRPVKFWTRPGLQDFWVCEMCVIHIGQWLGGMGARWRRPR